jgi:hypothetical protein
MEDSACNDKRIACDAKKLFEVRDNNWLVATKIPNSHSGVGPLLSGEMKLFKNARCAAISPENSTLPNRHPSESWT